MSYLLGVPVSSQWQKSGHYYPTQICQFALSYWSKYVLSEAKEENKENKMVHKVISRGRLRQQDSSRRTTYENGVNIQSDYWQGSTMARVIRDSCVHFTDEISLNLDNEKGLALYILV